MTAKMQAQTFQISIPPSQNAMYRAVDGKVIKSRAYRDWEAKEGWALKAQKPVSIVCPIAVDVVIERDALDKRRDLDNCLKAVLDLLVSQSVIPSDKHTQVPCIFAKVAVDVPGGQCAVTVIPITDLEAA